MPLKLKNIKEESIFTINLFKLIIMIAKIRNNKYEANNLPLFHLVIKNLQ